MAAMMSIIFITAILATENVAPAFSDDNLQIYDEIPLTKSLGFSIRQNFGKKLDDVRLEQEYRMLYNEMMKDSQNIASGEQDELELTRIKEKAHRSRAIRRQTPVRLRQVRSQANRRQKLNSQSLRSHLEHSRPSSSEEY